LQQNHNYFLQIQTLINQRALSPRVQKVESEPTARTKETVQQIEKICKNCL